MTTGAPGAVFFLGTRAHYQVLQQPDSHYDAENGNTETVYRNPSTWDTDLCCRGPTCPFADISHGTPAFAVKAGYSVLDDVNVTKGDQQSVVKRRNTCRSSETDPCQCECDNMKPSQQNNVKNDNEPAKEKPSRRSLLTFLSSLSRRKKRLGSKLHCLKHIESMLTICTYRESCRCLDCQSSYFDCDEEEYDQQSEDDAEYSMYIAQMQSQGQIEPPPEDEDEDEDDEVFDDEVQSDSTSTDMLIEPTKMSVSSESSVDPESMDIGVAAGTPLLLNFLLNHPISCSIQ